MWQRLRQTISRYRKWVVPRARDLLERWTANREKGRENTRRTAARARFWADLREGQREAEVHSSRQNP